MSDLLTALCPMFKDEVYRRTARIGNVTIGGTVALVGGMLWYAVWSDEFDVIERLLCMSAVVALVATLLIQISREASRHAGAKQALIQVERALGLFESGRYLPDAPLYPEEWSVPPPRSRATRAAQVVLTLLGVLFVLEILIT